MSEELKPCASCGGVARMMEGYAVQEVWPHGAFYRAYCTGCQLRQLFHRTEAKAIAAWNRRTPVQPEPAAPTPDTFMGEPVLTRWKPLNRDDSRLTLWQSMHKRDFGNPGDDKLMLEWLWENGYSLCKRAPAQPEPAAPTLTTCNCRWDGETQVQQCTLHEAHVQSIHEWAERARAAESKAAPTVVEPGRWGSGEGWESLAWQLCADENGEDACNELIWEGGPIPEPWGERWLKYEGEAKRLIALVHKHAPPRAVEPEPVAIVDGTFNCDAPLGTWLYTHPPRTPLTDAELERLKLCEKRLAAVTRWLEANQPDVFRRGIWDAVIAASEGERK